MVNTCIVFNLQHNGIIELEKCLSIVHQNCLQDLTFLKSGQVYMGTEKYLRTHQTIKYIKYTTKFTFIKQLLYQGSDVKFLAVSKNMHSLDVL